MYEKIETKINKFVEFEKNQNKLKDLNRIDNQINKIGLILNDPLIFGFNFSNYKDLYRFEKLAKTLRRLKRIKKRIKKR